ncbi:MAG: DinB family protein [Steroidobacteraceae bacterium]
MLNTDTAILLTQYNAWADRALLAAVAQLPAEEVYRQRKTLFGSMLGTLNHNYQVDLIWQAHLLGKEHGFSNRRGVLHPVFDDLMKSQGELDDWFIEWARSQDSTTLGEKITFRFISGRIAEMPRGGILLHTINHKTYHRGWVSEMFYDIGEKPPETDLSVYLCEVRA